MDKFYLDQSDQTQVFTTNSAKRLNTGSESPSFSKCRRQLKLIEKNLKKFLCRKYEKEKQVDQPLALMPIEEAGINKKQLNNMPAKLKIRSVSVEDLGHIVKQMIDGVLEDNDQVAKLRQAVFQEYYFKKMEELKQVKAKIDGDYILNQKPKQSLQIHTSESILSDKPFSFEIGSNETGHIETINALPSCDIIDDDNLAKESDSHKLLEVQCNDSHLVDCLSTEPTVIKSSKSGKALISEIADEKAEESLIIDEFDSPVIHVMRKRQKYIKIPEDTDLKVASIHNSNIALGLASHHTTTNLTQTSIDTVNSKENIQTVNNVLSNMEIIEWQSSAVRKGVSQKNGQTGKTREIQVQFKSRGDIAFENWKKEKTNAYNRIFREDKKRISIEQAAKAKKIEKKEAANEAYLYWRRQQDARQKLIKNRKRILVEMESQKLKSKRAKSKENSEAFKVWKRQKDIKLKEKKMYMMAYSEQSNPQQQVKSQKPKPGVHVAFNMWLDQLDCVLHQKYLRERRYLVRSFYCQPAYFGSAALSVR